MKRFRLNLNESKEFFENSICEIESPIIRGVADNMTSGQVGGWLKAHGDVTWGKGDPTQQPKAFEEGF